MTARQIGIIEHPHPIIVGSGIAGLSTALGLDGSTIVTASFIGSGSSPLAQGGIAAAIGPNDEPGVHAADTLAVGAGIVDPNVASMITTVAASRIDWLTNLGTRFDKESSGDTQLGREAGHSASRIVHAGGDATGAEVMRALREATAMRSDIELLPGTRLIDLVRSGDRIVGVLVDGPDRSLTAHLTPAVVLATGGIGGIYARSTNPPDVTGIGIAAAARHGVELGDLEFVQFHPTAMTSADHPAPLVTEALRGAGATLVDERGHRFMQDVHNDAELAPRDIVARAIWDHTVSGHQVFVDPTPIGSDMPERFPTVFSLAAQAGIDARTEWIPVAPAEHFHMGGIATDASGRTSLDGLWAVGEVASTGLHGANRLASNSLLEGLVMGHRVANDLAELALDVPGNDLEIPHPQDGWASPTEPDRMSDIRTIAWRDLGIVRSGEGLERAIRQLAGLGDISTGGAEVAALIARAALEREESRGAHYRSDHPTTDPHLAKRSVTKPEPRAMQRIGSMQRHTVAL